MRLLFGLALALGALAPGHALAEDADELLERGVALRGEGRDEEALALFERAYELATTPRALAQIALAEQALGRWVLAEQHLEFALQDRADRWIARNTRVLEEALTEIRSHVGELLVDTNVTDAELFIDGRAAATLPLVEPLHVPAGELDVEVRAPGRVTARRLITVRAGERSRETMHLVPVSATEANDGAGPDRVPAIAVLAGGGVALVAAIVGAIWWADRQSVVDFCAEASCTNRGELESARNAAVATTLVSVAVAAGLGVLGYLLWPRGEE